MVTTTDTPTPTNSDPGRSLRTGDSGTTTYHTGDVIVNPTPAGPNGASPAHGTTARRIFEQAITCGTRTVGAPYGGAGGSYSGVPGITGDGTNTGGGSGTSTVPQSATEAYEQQFINEGWTRVERTVDTPVGPQPVYEWERTVDTPAGPQTVTQQYSAPGRSYRPAGDLAGGEGLSRLRDFISEGEGGYDSVNRGTVGNSIVGSCVNGCTRNGKLISQLTFREIFQLQSITSPYNTNRIFAVGRYQIIPATMREIFPYSGLSDDDLFNPENQDILANILILGSPENSYYKRRNLSNYISGRSDNLFEAQLDFAREWASAPDPRTGNSYYGSGNRSAHTPAEVSAALRQAREDYANSN